ncbi:DUF4214 domain-containing protein [Candidatus Pacearchaeota archaeon]|nr:DUF4214 domain-containing protein [Candidatus Pacearchaeota archaeon]
MANKGRNKQGKKKKPAAKDSIDLSRGVQVVRQKAAGPQLPGISKLALPTVIGGDFDYDANDIAKYQAMIDEAPARTEKPRILFISEASYLKTGFSTYVHYVFSHLFKSDKYDLAEFGSYGYSPSVDPRARAVKWKYYDCMPKNQSEEQIYQQDREAQFGKWKLSQVLSDFRPDIILLHRDNWMDTHVLKNQLAGNAKIFWMACIDGFPQQWTWLEDYAKVDKCFGYSWFGKKVIETQTRTELAKLKNVAPVDVIDVIQPGVDLDVYRPLPRDEVYEKLGLGQAKHLRFIGTVMRNQPRKLFPRIIESFAQFIKRCPKESENVMLHLHTSVRDVGFNIPEAIQQNGVEHRVTFTYLCQNCGNIAISTFRGSPTQCPACKENKMDCPNTGHGLDPESFNYIYNMLDVYIQGSIAEGDGMPINEAKACEIPTLVSDYSAMYEKGRMPGGQVIVNDTIYTEHETMQHRSLFDRNDLVKKLKKLLGNEDYRQKMGTAARKEAAEPFYDWRLTAKKWEAYIDTCELYDRKDTWEKEDLEIREPSREMANPTSNDKEFVDWLYTEILCREKGPDPEGLQHWMSQLANGAPRDVVEKHFRKLIETENQEKLLMSQDSAAFSPNPVDRVITQLDTTDTFRILYAMPETAGDVLISTGIVDAIAKKYPEASIYFATQAQFADILHGNPQIKGVVEYDESMMLNYRMWEISGPSKGPFDIVFTPSIITQRIPHWIHSGYGPWLGRAYANMCDVEFGEQKIGLADKTCLKKYNRIMEDKTTRTLHDNDSEYVTAHAQTRTDTKDYDYINDVIGRLNRDKFVVVQVGGGNDKELPNVDYDLRGKTTPQELARVLKHAKLHIGVDSFPMHTALTVGTEVVATFGGTHSQKVINPAYKDLITAIDPPERGFCHTACNLTACAMKERGIDKCINSVGVDDVLYAVAGRLGDECIIKQTNPTLGAYIIIRDGVKYGFPFEQSIRAAAQICDEVVVVDGGSTDDTMKELERIAAEINTQKEDGSWEGPLMVYEHEWDMDNPTLFGDEKTYARQLCTSEWLIQLDADEIISEPIPGALLASINKDSNSMILDLPVINLYGDDSTIRVESNFWKWRVSQNDPKIVHGVHKEARQQDSEGRITMDKHRSDSCEYVHADTYNVLAHKPVFPFQYLIDHEEMKADAEGKTESYVELINKVIAIHPVVFHYSWRDLERKKGNGEFWDQTYHNKNSQTHNTTKDISKRIEDAKDILVKVDFDHPLKGLNRGSEV